MLERARARQISGAVTLDLSPTPAPEKAPVLGEVSDLRLAILEYVKGQPRALARDIAKQIARTLPNHKAESTWAALTKMVRGREIYRHADTSLYRYSLYEAKVGP